MSAPMAGLAGTDSKHSDHEDRQAGPDNVLGRADSVAGQLRGGKTPERPPASAPAAPAVPAAAAAVLELSAVVRWRIAAAPTETGRDPVSSRCRQHHQCCTLAGGLAGSDGAGACRRLLAAAAEAAAAAAVLMGQPDGCASRSHPLRTGGGRFGGDCGLGGQRGGAAARRQDAGTVARFWRGTFGGGDGGSRDAWLW